MFAYQFVQIIASQISSILPCDSVPRAWNNGNLKALLIVSMDEIASPNAHRGLSEASNTIPSANREKLQTLRVMSVGEISSLYNVGNLSDFAGLQWTDNTWPKEGCCHGDR
jgi:hypothetical protein